MEPRKPANTALDRPGMIFCVCPTAVRWQFIAIRVGGPGNLC